MKTLEREIQAYAKLRDQLEPESWGQWAVVYGDELIGVYELFTDAAATAVKRFGRGPCLIRQIGEDEVMPLHIPSLWQVFNDVD